MIIKLSIKVTKICRSMKFDEKNSCSKALQSIYNQKVIGNWARYSIRAHIYFGISSGRDMYIHINVTEEILHRKQWYIITPSVSIFMTFRYLST